MGRVAPWTQRLWELVQDGPVPKSLAIARMAVLVPPGRAFRKGVNRYEWSRNETRRNVKTNRRVVHTSLKKIDSETLKDMRIRQGSDTMASQAIWSQQRSGHIEEFEEDGVTYLRLGPVPWPGNGAPSGPISHDSQMRPWTVYLRDRVALGDHIPLTHLIRDMAALVPDSRAEDAYWQWLQHQRKNRGVERPYLSADRPTAERVRLGAEQVAGKTITSAKRSGRVRIDDLDGVKMVSIGQNPWPTGR